MVFRKQGHDWWSGIVYTSTEDFDPVEKEYVDSVVIEENDYYFNSLCYEPVDDPKLYRNSQCCKDGTPSLSICKPLGGKGA